MRICTRFMIVAVAAMMFSPVLSHADIVTATSQADARLITEPSGNRDDNNGGNTSSGRLIGTNNGLVNNFLIQDFSNLSAALSGTVVSSATVTVETAPNIPPNAGSAQDFIVLNEIAIGNIGWIAGNGAIGGGDNPADDGSVSYLYQSTFAGPSGNASTAWVDSSGAAVANVTGAFTAVDTISGYTANPGSITFTVNQATAQGWIDNGLAGLALSAVNADGNNLSRFNFGPASTFQINFHAVPEPSTGLLMAVLACAGVVRRRR